MIFAPLNFLKKSHYNSLGMKDNKGLQSLSDIFTNRQSKKPPAYQWQELALKIIKELGVPAFKRNSVFKVCKENNQIIIERALNETKELAQKERWKYFFKVLADK